MAIDFNKTVAAPSSLKGKINFDKTVVGGGLVIPSQAPTATPVVSQPKAPEPVKKKGFLRTLGEEIVKPAGEIGVSVYNLGSSIKNLAQGKTQKAAEALETSRKLPFLGETKPAFTGKETTGQAAKKMIGYGAEVASYAPFGAGITAVGKATAKGAIKTGLKAGLVEGAIGGGMGSFGRSLQDNESIVNTIKNTLTGIGLGGVLGGTIGASIPAGGALLNKVRGVSKVANMTDEVVETIGKTASKVDNVVTPSKETGLIVRPPEVKPTVDAKGNKLGEGFVMSDNVNKQATAITKGKAQLELLKDDYQIKLRDYNQNPTPAKQKIILNLKKNIDELASALESASSKVSGAIPEGTIKFEETGQIKPKIEATGGSKTVSEGINIPPEVPKTAPESPVFTPKTIVDTTPAIEPPVVSQTLSPVTSPSVLASKAQNFVDEAKTLPKQITKQAPQVKESKLPGVSDSIMKQKEIESLKRTLLDEAPIRETRGQPGYPKVTAETPGARPSNVKEVVNSRDILKRMNEDPDEPAMYLGRNRAEQSEMITNFINKEYQRAVMALDDPKVLPKEFSPVRFYKEMGRVASNSNDPVLIRKVSKSPLASSYSQAGSELSMGVGDDVYDTISALENINKRFKKAEEYAMPKEVPKIKKAMKSVKTNKSEWLNFVNEIKC